MTANSPQIEMLPDVLKSALAPFTGFQRELRSLTQGFSEQLGVAFYPVALKNSLPFCSLD